jgi:hypothetical protein
MTINECKVNISNHLALTDVARTVKYNGLIHDVEGSVIIVKCIVVHTNSVTLASLSNYVPDIRVDLVTDITSWINPLTFEVVTKSLVAILDENDDVVDYESRYPVGSVREYDYWLNLFESPIELYPLLQMMIGLRASQGKFD